MRKPRRRIIPKGDINVTPFIDILLVLLVIFMTITPNAPRGLDTLIPQPNPPGPEQHREDVVILNMDKNGIIRINRDEVPRSGIVGRLQDIFKTRNDRTVFVQADKSLLFNDVAQLIDAAKGAGISRIGVMTEQVLAK